MECQNGVLINIAEWNPNRHDQFDNNWESGCLSSMDKRRNGFAQRFDYWSAKMKMPDAGQGAWCAFWLASASGIPNGGTKGYEIDIVEAYGGQLSQPQGATNITGSFIPGMLTVARGHNLTKAGNGPTFQAATRSITGTSTAAR